MRILNSEGIEEFRSYLTELNSGTATDPPRKLLESNRYSEESSVDISTWRDDFDSKYDLARFLDDCLPADLTPEFQFQKRLFATLDLKWFDLTCPEGKNGSRNPGQVERHIPKQKWNLRYRHLVRGSFLLYRMHGEDSRVFLAGAPHVHGEMSEQIVSRQELVTSGSVVRALSILYFDERKWKLKRGFSARDRPGTLRRFVNVMNQLARTYDLFEISGEQIVELLPREFDRFLNR